MTADRRFEAPAVRRFFNGGRLKLIRTQRIVVPRNGARYADKNEVGNMPKCLATTTADPRQRTTSVSIRIAMLFLGGISLMLWSGIAVAITYFF